MENSVDITNSNILIVDDLKENLLVLDTLLKEEGYLVDKSTSGEDALKKCMKNDYDLFILDVQMPTMDGFELAQYLKNVNRTKHIPIIFVTALSQDIKHVKKGFDSGAMDYLPKPIDRELLKLKVRTFLEHKHQRTHLINTQKQLVRLNDGLENTVEELKVAMEQLHTTQFQLVQSAKMASVGQLTAGVAHELNNPINFISAGAAVLDNDITDIFKILEQYEKEESNTPDINNQNKVNALKEELEYDVLKINIVQTIADMKMGAIRVAAIVQGLRNFSRIDTGEKVRANVHEGLDDTLTILGPKLKDKANVVKNYAEDLEEISCYLSQLNQVFLNILANAEQAIEKDGTVTITTKKDKNKVSIIIADDGVGMSEEVQQRMFDPFYTTKEIGDGVGLGMSITYGIVKEHNGTITVQSEVGKGTTLIIELPLE
ncbi:MAG: response regulator [Flavobacteriales bacterium]|nr:response regulator [Flavobacteriales bacterium]